LKHIKVAKSCKKVPANTFWAKLVQDWNPVIDFQLDCSLHVEFISADLEQNKGIYAVYNG
jgi:hypothetical protein